MGGVFSGNHSSRGGKQATASLPEARLTYQHLDRLDLATGPRIRIEADGWATVVFGAMHWPVRIENIPLNFGGARRWLICSTCSKRRQALYVRDKALACRSCLGLRFESQHENRRSRMFRQLEKVRAKLGWQPGALAPYGAKPQGMHEQTYARLYLEAAQLTESLLLNVNEWISKAERALDARD
jgi:hypothetical protein